MGFGRSADIVAGQLSHLLHGIRGPRENTLPDLERYLDLTPAEFFPAPPPLTGVHEEKSIAERWHRTTTLRWRSTHQVLCPNYRKRHQGEYASNQQVWGRWIRPERRQRAECLVYVHGWL